MASALPVVPAATKQNTLHIEGEPYEISENFGKGLKVSPFYKAGAMQNGEVYTAEVTADYHGPFETLGDVLVDDSDVPESYFIDSAGNISRVERRKSAPTPLVLPICTRKVEWRFLIRSISPLAPF